MCRCRLDVGEPFPLWPANARRAMELDVMIYLAGPAAERYAPAGPVELAAGYRPDPKPRTDHRLAELTLAERKMLQCGDELDPDREAGDLPSARRLCATLSPPELPCS